MLLQQLLRRIGAKGRAATGQFITGDSEAVNIGRRGRQLATNLLRGDIRPRPLAGDLAGEQLEEASRDPPGQGVIDHPDFARLVEQDILGLDVAVHPSLIVHVRQRGGRLFDDPVQVGLFPNSLEGLR